MYLTESNYLSFFKKVVQLLTDLDIDYCLIGGHALSAYNFLRATTDIDFLVGLSLDELKYKLSVAGFKHVFGRRFSIANYPYEVEFLFSGESLVKDDLVFKHPDEIKEWNNHLKCWVASFKSLIEMKLYAYTYNVKRMSDGGDVQKLLLRNPQLSTEFYQYHFDDPLVQENWEKILKTIS